MSKHSQDPTQSLDVTDTPTYLYPSSDSTVLLSDAGYDDQPFKTGKHSVVRGKRVGASSSHEARDPFAPKTVAPQEPEDDIVLTKTKRNGCLRSAIFAVVACIVAAAAFWVVCTYGM